jgi:hypothetical protein
VLHGVRRVRTLPCRPHCAQRVIAGQTARGLSLASEQTITELTFESSKGDLGVFSDLPLVTRSELIRSLRALS